jgi:hypothetical protein
MKKSIAALIIAAAMIITAASSNAYTFFDGTQYVFVRAAQGSHNRIYYSYGGSLSGSGYYGGVKDYNFWFPFSTNNGSTIDIWLYNVEAGRWTDHIFVSRHTY